MRKKSKYGMPPPQCRAEMEHNVFLTIDDINRNIDNKSYIANRLWTLGSSLEMLKHLPNGRINLPTIDERMRNISNMMDWMKYLPKSYHDK